MRDRVLQSRMYSCHLLARISKAGEPVLLLQPSSPWERGLLLDITEGPWMYKNNNRYYLMYSGNEAMFGNYAVGYASADNPMGPFRKYAGNPIVHTRLGNLFENGVYSPGHNSVVRDGKGDDWFVYHQKRSLTDLGFSQRYTCRDRLHVNAETGELSVRTTPMRRF